MNLMKYIFLYAALLAMSNILSAQVPIFERTFDVNVQAYGENLNLAWSGGFNTPQFSQTDLNNDGINDLFVFDRTSNSPMALINNNTPGATADYHFGWQAIRHFPSSLRDWVLLLDYDCDGAADIFTSYGNGIRVYKGNFEADGYLAFQLAESKLTFDGGSADLTVSNYDLPAIADIDNDGDIDILTFDISGGVVHFYDNQSIELGYGCDSLVYHLETECWGQFYETGNDAEILLGICTDPGIANAGSPTVEHSFRTAMRHPGSTLLATDLDGDMDKELILGDVSFDNLVMVVNGGTPDFAEMVSQDITYPSYDLPAVMPTFPAAYQADINNDGLLDLLVSPNGTAQGVNHYQCVWYYKNNGTVPNSFEFQTDTLLVNQSMDVARAAKPAFFDHNGDGLLDLVVGNFGYLVAGEHQSVLALYENVGTPTQPAFRLASRNYMDVRAQLVTDPPELHPAFGDLDNDGDMDMILGDDDGYLHYFVNNPDGAGVANFTLQQERYKGIDVGKSSAPQIVDVDRDGLPDLVVGERKGVLNLFHNTGTPTNPDFEFIQNPVPCHPNDGCWGEVFVHQTWDDDPNAYAVPFLIENNAGEWELLVGSSSGKVFHYTGIEGNELEGTFTLNSSELIDSIGLRQSSPTAADVDGDGMLEVVVGTYRGGLQWYEQTGNTGFRSNALPLGELQITPNPAANAFEFVLQAPNGTGEYSYRFYDLTGKTLREGFAKSGKTQQLSVTDLPTGLYLLEVRDEHAFVCKKVVLTDVTR